MTKRPDPARVVREWQRPVYNLARRILGNDADAADGTQEVFLRVLRSLDRYDSARPFRPWLFRVARNTLQNLLAKRETRARIEAVAAEPRPREDAMEVRETERAVARALIDLDADDRSLIALHYYEGLSQTELAEVVDLPRTTVQTRLRRALDRLRGSLRAAGFGAVVPGLEAHMRTCPPAPVPKALAKSLLAAAAPGPVSAALFSLGGIAVTKTALTIAALAVLAALAAAWFLASPGGAAEPAPIRPEGAAPPLPITPIGKADVAPEKSITSPPAPGQDAEEDAAEAKVARKLDEVGRFFAIAMPGVLRQVDGREWGTDPSEHKARNRYYEYLQKMILVLDSVKREAGPTDLTLFYQPTVFGPLVASVAKHTLSLSEEETMTVRGRAMRILEATLGDTDLESSTPLERFRTRRAVLDALADLVPDPKWPDVHRAFSWVFTRGHRLIAYMPGDFDPEDAADRFLDEWRDSFGFPEADAARFRPIVERFAADVEALVRGHGLSRDDQPDDATRTRIDAEVAALQAAAERRMLDLLTDEQRRAVPARRPLVIRLSFSDTFRHETVRSFGF